MKKYYLQKSSLSYALCLLFAVILIGMGSCYRWIDPGCTLSPPLNNTNEIVDKAMSDINGNPENYNKIMQEAIYKVEDTDMKAQLKDALGNAIVMGSTEIKCPTMFIGDYLTKRLRVIKAAYIKKPLPPLEPRLCRFAPTEIDMNLSADSRNTITVTGYFLNEDFSRYKLYHYTKDDTTRFNETSHLSVSTDFKLTINLGNDGIALNENSAKLRLMWENKLIVEIPVIQPH